MSARFHRWVFVLVVAVNFNTAFLQTANGQLSRARRAVRRSKPTPPRPTVRPAPQPAAKPEPVAPTPAPVPEPAQQVVATPTPPPPTPAPQTQPSVTPTTSTAPTQKPAGKLNSARNKIRQAKPPAAPPSPSPSPSPSPTPPPRTPQHHNPRHSLTSQGARRRHQERLYPIVFPTFWTQPVFIANTFAPTTNNVEIFEQPLLVPEPPPVEAGNFMMETAPIPIPPRPILPPEKPVGNQLPQMATYEPAVISPVVHSQVDSHFGFAAHPYENGLPGLMAHGLDKEISGRAFFEYGSDFDRLDRKGLGFLIENEYRFGLDMKWDSYVEDLGGGWTDELHLTDVNLLYRLAESERYIIRAGAGLNVLGDAWGTEFGFNLTAKADLFPIDPIVLSAEVDLGTVGDAEMFHLLGKVGIVFDRFEIFGGYDYRTLGSVPLEGALLGAQVWF